MAYEHTHEEVAEAHTIVPVACYTCGAHHIGREATLDTFIEEVYLKGRDTLSVLDEIYGMQKYCCRQMLLSQVITQQMVEEVKEKLEHKRLIEKKAKKITTVPITAKTLPSRGPAGDYIRWYVFRNLHTDYHPSLIFRVQFFDGSEVSDIVETTIELTTKSRKGKKERSTPGETAFFPGRKRGFESYATHPNTRRIFLISDITKSFDDVTENFYQSLKVIMSRPKGLVKLTENQIVAKLKYKFEDIPDKLAEGVQEGWLILEDGKYSLGEYSPPSNTTVSLLNVKVPEEEVEELEKLESPKQRRPRKRSTSGSEEEIEAKEKKTRTRKSSVSEEIEAKEKKPRGRPRKRSVSFSEEEIEEVEEKKKPRKRSAERRVEEEVEEKPKRGRPRKRSASPTTTRSRSASRERTPSPPRKKKLPTVRRQPKEGVMYVAR